MVVFGDGVGLAEDARAGEGVEGGVGEAGVDEGLVAEMPVAAVPGLSGEGGVVPVGVVVALVGLGLGVVESVVELGSGDGLDGLNGGLEVLVEL